MGYIITVFVLECLWTTIQSYTIVLFVDSLFLGYIYVMVMKLVL